MESSIYYNIKAENGVLGCILLDSKLMDVAISQLKHDSFYDIKNSKVFYAMKRLYDKNADIELITVCDELRMMGILGQGGLDGEYLTSIVGDAFQVGNFEYYVSIVVNCNLLRRLKRSSMMIEELSSRPTQDGEDIRERVYDAENIIMNMCEIPSVDTTISDVVEEEFDTLRKLYKGEIDMQGVSSGFYDLDKITCGFQPGDVVIFAARPSIGKTTLALNCVINVALKRKEPVYFCSLEMKKGALIRRLMSMCSKVPLYKIKDGAMTKEEYERVMGVEYLIESSPLFINDDNSMSCMDIKAKARRIQREHGLSMIVIDYIQLLPTVDKESEGRCQDVTAISRYVKGIASDLHVPVLALSQMSRKIEDRVSGLPKLSDLRDSGALEQDADSVMFIHRDNTVGADTTKSKIIVAKQRNGAIGSVDLYFNGEIVSFENLKKEA